MSPLGCMFPMLCSSKSGASTGTFGYAPSVREAITDFVVDGNGALITNSTLDIDFH